MVICRFKMLVSSSHIVQVKIATAHNKVGQKISQRRIRTCKMNFDMDQTTTQTGRFSRQRLILLLLWKEIFNYNISLGSHFSSSPKRQLSIHVLHVQYNNEAQNPIKISLSLDGFQEIQSRIQVYSWYFRCIPVSTTSLNVS